MRPDHELYFLDVGIQPSYSFPSNHAFNLFALSALVWILRDRGYLKGVKFPIALSLVAIFISLSRVLIGRHYPLDILAGLIFGTLYAFLAVFIATKFRAWRKRH